MLNQNVLITTVVGIHKLIHGGRDFHEFSLDGLQ